MKELVDLVNIPCDACGKCCPNTCEHKQGSLCLAHPTMVGEPVSNDLRGDDCICSPWEIFQHSVYCPPVVEAIEQLAGVKITSKDLGNGQVGVNGFLRIMSAIECLFDRRLSI